MDESNVKSPVIMQISCDYCHTILEGECGWDSHFEADKQYAVKQCNCGKRKVVPVELQGFDPRDFFEKQSKTVESGFPTVFEKQL